MVNIKIPGDYIHKCIENYCIYENSVCPIYRLQNVKKTSCILKCECDAFVLVQEHGVLSTEQMDE